MSAKAGTAFIDFRGDWSNLNKEVANLIGPLTSKFGKLGAAGAAGLGAVATGAAVAGKALYDIGEEFDDAYDTISVKTGATGKQLQILEGDFEKVFASVPASADDAGTAIGELNQRLGLTGKPLEDVAKQVLELSRLTETDLSGNITSITRLFADWSVKTAQQPATLDKLWRASQATGIEIGKLSEYMVQFGSPLRQLGFNFDTAAAMFSKFEKEGVNLQTLMPGLRMALKNLANPTDELAGKLKGLGITAKEPDQALREVIGTIEKAKTVGDATELATGVFGGRAWSDAAAAIQEGRFKFGDLIQTIDHGRGSVMASSKSTRDLAENWKILSNRLKVLVEPAATAVFGAVSDLSLKLTKLNFQKLAHSLGTSGAELREFGQDVGDIFRRIGPVIGQELQQAGAFFKDFAGVVRGMTKIVSGVLQGNFDKAWDDVKDTFRSGIGATTHLLLGITAPIRALGVKVGDALGSMFDFAWDKAKDIFRGGANEVIDLLNKMIGLINKLPFVDIGTIGHIGGGGGGKAVKRQQGGVVPGQGDGDTFHTSLPAGTFVLNKRATSAFGFAEGGAVPVALEPGERFFMPAEVRRVGRSNLEQMNAAVPRFQTGGSVQKLSIGGDIVSAGESLVGKGAGFVIDQLPDPADYLPGWLASFGDYLRKAAADWIKEGFADEKFGSLSIAPGVILKSHPELQPGISSILATVLKRWPDLAITSTTGGGHAENSLHYEGRAADLAASSTYMLKAAAWIHQNLTPALTEGIHNPNLSVKYGHDVPAGYWGASTWADHLDHIHLGKQLGGFVQALAGGGLVGEVGSVLMRNSLDLVSSAGILGNAWRESRWDPSAIGTGGGGLWGFTTSPISLEDLKAYAENQGAAWDNEEVQTQFMLHHLPDSMRGAMNAMGSVEDTTTYFMKEWERPGVPALDERIEGAKKALKILGGEGGSDAHSFKEDVPAVYHGCRTDSLSLPSSIPDSLQGVNAELAKRRAELSRYRKAAAAAAKENKPAIEHALRGNITALKTRIHQLEQGQVKLRREAKMKKFTGKLGKKLAHLTGREVGIEGMERAFSEQSQLAEQLVDLEPLMPELPASFTDAQQEAAEKLHVTDLSAYIEGRERPAYQHLLNLAADWRNTILLAENAAAGHWVKGQGLGGLEGRWEDQVVATDNEIDRIGHLRDAHTAKWWNEHPKAKQNLEEQLERLPMLRFKDRELRKSLGEARDLFYPGNGRVQPPAFPLAGSGSFEEALTNVQGIHWPDQHELLAHLPALRAPGAFGGAIWDVQGSIEGLGLKIREATSSIEGGGSGGADNSEYAHLLEELLSEERGRSRLREIEERVFGVMPPYAGKAHSGAVVPGPPNQEKTMVVRGQERIRTPEQEVALAAAIRDSAASPAASAADGAQIQVLVHGDIISSRRDPVEVLIGDERFKAKVREINHADGRREARAAGRGLARSGRF